MSASTAGSNTVVKLKLGGSGASRPPTTAELLFLALSEMPRRKRRRFLAALDLAARRATGYLDLGGEA